jgi:DNA topoisomerase IB
VTPFEACDEPAGLRRVDLVEPGIRRIRRGRGFQYLAPGEQPIQDARELARIRALAVPPAWRDVWICPDSDGHIQAVGTDAAGRRQYRYHDRWREARDREKFDRVLRLARVLPDVRQELAGRLREHGLGRTRVLAGALRMLELGAFRVGGDEYAPDDDDSDGSFGLATLRREHVRRVRGEVRIQYPAKGGQWRRLALRDPEVHRLVGLLLRRGRTVGTADLLVYRNGRSWHDVRADDVNAYLKELAGEEFSAKDLRTWHATVLAAVTLARADPMRVRTEGGRKRLLSACYREVSAHLGNTPSVARQSYIDPRLTRAFEQGPIIVRAIQRAGESDGGPEASRDIIEPAVIRLLARQ